VVVIAGLGVAIGVAPAHAADGAALYAARCAACHDLPADRIPGRADLARMDQQEIVAAATQGVMRGRSSGLDLPEFQAIAAYLSRRAEVVAPLPVRATPARPLRMDGAAWRGWGNDPRNRRHQSNPGLTAEDVPRLKVKWVYRYGTSMAVGQPVLVDGWVFAGAQSGHVIALDAATGCLRWSHASGAPACTAISLGALPAGAPARIATWCADDRGAAHALNAETGAEIWSRQLDSHIAARVTGSPLLHDGRLYIPVSSAEEGWARNSAYACCTFRGSVVALDAATGAVIWRTYTISEVPHPYIRETDKAQRYGPAGAAVWSTPTLDEKRGLLYVASGNSYTDVPNTAATRSWRSISRRDGSSGRTSFGPATITWCPAPTPRWRDKAIARGTSDRISISAPRRCS
jgi:polyvinyl alcohol dehydrogenase (cytochrome)